MPEQDVVGREGPAAAESHQRFSHVSVRRETADVLLTVTGAQKMVINEHMANRPDNVLA